MANTLKFGNGEWYGKEDTILAYNDERNNFKPLPFNYERESSATRVNKDGLIETVGANEPRIDYKDDSKGALLLEPTRTNYVLLSNDFSSLTGNGFVTSNYGTSPEGLSVSRVLFTGVGQLIGASTSLGNGVVCNFSAYVKGVQGEFIKFAAGGVDIAHTFSGEWERLSGSATSINNSWNLNTYGGATARDFLMCAAQLEQGSYATSYIPTQGGAVTRLADSCDNGANEQVINSTEGTIYAEQKSLETNFTYNYFVAVSDGTNNNRLEIRQTSTGLQFLWRVGGTYQSQIVLTNAPFTSVIKFALRYSSANIKFYVNGSLVGTINSPTLYATGTLDNIEFANGGGGNNFRGTVKDLKYYNTALTDAELIALTQV